MQRRETKDCPKCHKTFSCSLRDNGTQYLVSRKNWEKRKFCSYKCANQTSAPISGLAKRGKCSENELKRLRALGENRRGLKRSPFTLEQIKRLSDAHIGQKAWNKGLKVPSIMGANNPNWIADRTQLKVGRRQAYNTRYKEWSRSVKDRDGWKCRISNEDCQGRLEAHHILNWQEYVELRYDINNGITLCHAHHPRGRVKEKRMVPVLQGLLSVSKDQLAR